MKFLIQKINKEVRHDFAFTLLEAIRFDKWLYSKESTMKYQFLNTIDVVEPNDIYPPFEFTHRHYNQKCVPIGSVDFVIEYLQRMYGIMPKPINVPESLFKHANRYIKNGDQNSLNLSTGHYFVKSNDRIKGFHTFYQNGVSPKLPDGNYQISRKIPIMSEWRAFVYENKLVGLQNYAGDFRMFPDIKSINRMIGDYYLAEQSPIAYTLDVGVSESDGTFVIEVHDFFSCGLYGFADLKILPYMFHRWFFEYINKSK